MDVVYMVRAGANEELRYSLRSLRNVQHDRVWVFGAGPDWFTGRRVQVPQSGSKQRNGMATLDAMIEHPGISDPFILFNDDFFALEPVEVQLLDRGSLEEITIEHEARYPKSAYTRRMRLTLEILRGLGFSDPLSFELHLPMVLYKDTLRDVVALMDDVVGLHWRTIHGALRGDESRTVADVKLCTLEDPLPSGPWLSTNDQTFEVVRPLLEQLFTEACVYEEANMVKVRALRKFRDVQAQVVRVEGEEFEVTPERAEEINATRFGGLVAMLPKSDDECTAEEPPATVKDIKDLLTRRGVEFRGVTKKADLLKLL